MTDKAEMVATLKAYRELHDKLVGSLFHCTHSPHLRSETNNEAEAAKIVLMDQAATTPGMRCDPQNVYHAICTAECSFITTSDDASPIFFCVDHANIHYCGHRDCDRYTDDPSGRTCMLTGTRFEAGGYMIDDCMATGYTNRPKKRDDDGGKGGGAGSDTDETGASTKRTRRLKQMNSITKKFLENWSKHSATKRPHLFETMRRMSMETVRCTRKRMRLHDDSEDDDDEFESDDEFSDDVFHHRRERRKAKEPAPSHARSRKIAVAAAAAAAATASAPGSNQKRPVTEEMRQKQRPLFRRVANSGAAAKKSESGSLPLPPPPPPPSPSPSKSSLSSSLKLNDTSNKKARGAPTPSSAAFQKEEAHEILRKCIACRNEINDAADIDQQAPFAEVTQSDLQWFGDTCYVLWKSLTETPAYTSRSTTFPTAYLCLFVLLNVTRGGFHYRITKNEETRSEFIRPNPVLLGKAPRVSDIQNIKLGNNRQFTNRAFTNFQRRILRAFASDKPGETERVKRAKIEEGGASSSSSSSSIDGVPADSFPDLTAVLIHQPSKALVTEAATAAVKLEENLSALRLISDQRQSGDPELLALRRIQAEQGARNLEKQAKASFDLHRTLYDSLSETSPSPSPSPSPTTIPATRRSNRTPSFLI